jgi:glycerate dehydrogenase
MERIVFLDRDTVRADFRSPNFAHEWIEYPMTQPEDVIERVRNATIAVTNKVALRKKDLEQLPKLRMIAVAATGIDCVDADYCRDKGIPVLNVRNYAVHSVPEHVFTLIFALRRNLIAYQEAVHSGKWQNSEIFCLLDYPIHDLHNSTLGIIGYGTLGQRVEKLARAFGLNVIILVFCSVTECGYFINLYFTRKHSVTASNRYVFRYRKLAKEINTLIDCFCLKTKQLIQFSNIEAFSS